MINQHCYYRIIGFQSRVLLTQLITEKNALIRNIFHCANRGDYYYATMVGLPKLMDQTDAFEFCNLQIKSEAWHLGCLEKGCRSKPRHAARVGSGGRERWGWLAEYGAMVVASSCRPRQPSSDGTIATDRTSTTPAARTPAPVREIFSIVMALRIGNPCGLARCRQVK